MKIILTGPTASGKSKLAISLAEKINGEIINADSMQLYKDLPILTSQPETNSEIKHHLYEVLNPNDQATVAWWLEQVNELIKQIENRNKTPIIVGGTGFYISAFIEGISDIPVIPKHIKEEVKKKFNSQTMQEFWNDLIKINPEINISPTDSQRMQRAYEVFLATGKPITSWWNNKSNQKTAKNIFIVLIMPNRTELYEECNNRFLKMIESGVIEEVNLFFKKHYAITTGGVLKAIGLNEIKSYLNNEITLENAILMAQKNTRNYVKKQTTWFLNKITPDLLINNLITSKALCDTAINDIITKCIKK